MPEECIYFNASLSMITVIMLLWNQAFANNFVLTLISPTFVQNHKILLRTFLERELD